MNVEYIFLYSTKIFMSFAQKYVVNQYSSVMYNLVILYIHQHYIHSQNMETYLLRNSDSQIHKEKEVKYLKKYTNLSKDIHHHNTPQLLSATESPPTHMEIIQKCPIELNQIRKIKQLKIDTNKENRQLGPADNEVSKRFKLLRKVFRRTHRAEEIFIKNQNKKQIRKSSIFEDSKKDLPSKFCPPPFGYYDRNYSQVQRRIPSLDISRLTRKTPQIRSMSPSIDVTYNYIQAQPVSFDMTKQLSRNRSSNTKICGQPDIRVLQSQYQFNSLQQKKYPIGVPCLKLKFRMDKSMFPCSMAQINSMSLDILRKYNFDENDKKFAYLKKYNSKKQ